LSRIPLLTAWTVMVALVFGSPQTHFAEQQSHHSPIVLRSTTTIGPRPGKQIIECSYADTGIPLGFSLEIIPEGGTLTVRLDGDLVPSWDEDSVSVGKTLGVEVGFDANAPRLGSIGAKYGYHFRPGYQIDFDSTFHDTLTFKHWSHPDIKLQDYLIRGERFGKFALTDTVPEVNIGLTDTIPTAPHNAFLMADSIMRGTQNVVEPLRFEVSPYPCIRLSVDASVKTTFAFEMGTDTLCLRYAPPTDTLCWQKNSGLDCVIDHGVTWEVPVPIPCETVKEFVVPLCPVRAAGWAHVTVNTELTVNQLKLWYTCPPPASPPNDPDTLYMVPSDCVKSLTWVDQDLYFSTDKDDAIFDIPVTLADVNITLADSLDTLLGPLDEVKAGDRYKIGWDPSIDDALTACCSDNSGSVELNVVYFSVESADSNSVCSGQIAVGLSDGTPYEQEWRVPDISCFPDGTEFRVMLEFYCTASGRILHRAWSDTFTYRE
jgi:hypothetical protein